MKRVRKGYRDFWSQRLLIDLKRIVAEPGALDESYREEADFLSEVLRLCPGQKVLDLGCGTGEHCIALARHDLEVTGIDIAPVLVEHARAQAADVGVSATFLCADMRTFRPEVQFDGAFTSSGTFGLYEDDTDNRSVLRTIAASLAEGGRFLIGPSGPGLLGRDSFSSRDWFCLEDGYLLRERAWDKSMSLFRESVLFVGEDGCITEFGGFDDRSDGQSLRVYSLGELQAMIAEEGLCFDAAYGSFDLPPEPHDRESSRLLIAGHKQKRGS